MPWLVVPYDTQKTLNQNREKYKVIQMPTLILLDAKKGRVVSLNARDDIFTGMNAHETFERWI